MNEKIRYEYALSEENAIFNEKLKILAQVLLDKSVTMATP